MLTNGGLEHNFDYDPSKLRRARYNYRRSYVWLMLG